MLFLESGQLIPEGRRPPRPLHPYEPVAYFGTAESRSFQSRFLWTAGTQPVFRVAFRLFQRLLLLESLELASSRPAFRRARREGKWLPGRYPGKWNPRGNLNPRDVQPEATEWALPFIVTGAVHTGCSCGGTGSTSKRHGLLA
jgi:hypothetical protein